MFNPDSEVARNARVVGSTFGSKSDARVYCKDQVILEKYNDLAELARNGNYWADQTVSCILGLISGRLSMDNVFVRRSSVPISGLTAFSVDLPGVSASLEKHGDDGLVLSEFQWGEGNSFSDLQQKARKPAFWRAIKGDNNWRVNYLLNDQSSGLEMNAWVAVSDRSETAIEAALVCAKGLESIDPTVKRYISGSSGFIMHFTPGRGSVGGIANFRQSMEPQKSRCIQESAILLAQAMYKARGVENVTWVSDSGGSGVLTQAMKILADNNIELSKHSVMLNYPSTRPSAVMDLASRLGLEFLGVNWRGSPMELVRRTLFFDSHLKWCLFGLAIAGAASGFGLVVVGVSMLASMGVLVGMTFVAKTLNALVKSVAPKTHRKIREKFER